MWNCTFGGLLWLTLPFLIGLVTGWWVWAQKPGPAGGASVSASAPATTAQAFTTEPTFKPEVAADVPGAESASQGQVARMTAIGIPEAIGEPDDLLQIKGIGPKLNAVLNDIGVVRFDQIAAWSEGEIARVDDHLGAFRGRIVRDAWVEQASLLARGQIGEFEARFGKLDTENK